jgi:hypothetical protein
MTSVLAEYSRDVATSGDILSFSLYFATYIRTPDLHFVTPTTLFICRVNELPKL